MRDVKLQTLYSSGHFSWVMTLIILHLTERARRKIKLMVLSSIFPRILAITLALEIGVITLTFAILSLKL